MFEGVTKVSLRKLLEESKWCCVGMYYQLTGVGDAFEKTSEYISRFNRNDRSFIISNPNASYEGSYQLLDKDSLLICNGYEDGIKKEAIFKVSIKNSALLLTQIQKRDESCFDYEFKKQ